MSVLHRLANLFYRWKPQSKWVEPATVYVLVICILILWGLSSNKDELLEIDGGDIRSRILAFVNPSPVSEKAALLAIRIDPDTSPHNKKLFQEYCDPSLKQRANDNASAGLTLLELTSCAGYEKIHSSISVCPPLFKSGRWHCNENCKPKNFAKPTVYELSPDVTTRSKTHQSQSHGSVCLQMMPDDMAGRSMFKTKMGMRTSDENKVEFADIAAVQKDGALVVAWELQTQPRSPPTWSGAPPLSVKPPICPIDEETWDDVEIAIDAMLPTDDDGIAEFPRDDVVKFCKDVHDREMEIKKSYKLSLKIVSYDHTLLKETEFTLLDDLKKSDAVADLPWCRPQRKAPGDVAAVFGEKKKVATYRHPVSNACEHMLCTQGCCLPSDPDGAAKESVQFYDPKRRAAGFPDFDIKSGKERQLAAVRLIMDKSGLKLNFSTQKTESGNCSSSNPDNKNDYLPARNPSIESYIIFDVDESLARYVAESSSATEKNGSAAARSYFENYASMEIGTSTLAVYVANVVKPVFVLKGILNATPLNVETLDGDDQPKKNEQEEQQEEQEEQQEDQEEQEEDKDGVVDIKNDPLDSTSDAGLLIWRGIANKTWETLDDDTKLSMCSLVEKTEIPDGDGAVSACKIKHHLIIGAPSMIHSRASTGDKIPCTTDTPCSAEADGACNAEFYNKDGTIQSGWCMHPLAQAVTLVKGNTYPTPHEIASTVEIFAANTERTELNPIMTVTRKSKEIVAFKSAFTADGTGFSADMPVPASTQKMYIGVGDTGMQISSSKGAVKTWNTAESMSGELDPKDGGMALIFKQPSNVAPAVEAELLPQDAACTTNESCASGKCNTKKCAKSASKSLIKGPYAHCATIPDKTLNTKKWEDSSLVLQVASGALHTVIAENSKVVETLDGDGDDSAANMEILKLINNAGFVAVFFWSTFFIYKQREKKMAAAKKEKE